MRMHFTLKNISLTIILLFEAIIFCVVLIKGQFGGEILHNVHPHYSSTATAFIPGFGGNAVSTQDYMDKFSQNHLATRALRVYVTKDNHVSTIGYYHKPLKNNPLIQLEFQDDTHPHRQASQMIYIMRYLYHKYHIKSINYVGHSSGGNIAFDYMIHHPYAKDVPKSKKLVTIGANYAPNDPLVHNLPKRLHILNIAGEIWNSKTDGEVPNDIVKPMGKLVRKHVNKYRYYIYSSNPIDAEHSMLHQSIGLDRIIGEFLWNNHYPKGAIK